MNMAIAGRFEGETFYDPENWGRVDGRSFPPVVGRMSLSMPQNNAVELLCPPSCLLSDLYKLPEEAAVVYVGMGKEKADHYLVYNPAITQIYVLPVRAADEESRALAAEYRAEGFTIYSGTDFLTDQDTATIGTRYVACKVQRVSDEAMSVPLCDVAAANPMDLSSLVFRRQSISKFPH